MDETMVRVAEMQNAKGREDLREAMSKLIREYGEDAVKSILAQMSSVPEFGDFVWCIYSIGEESFPGLKDGEVSRLMYLATMISHNGTVMVKRRMPKVQTDMQNLLGISRQQTSRFYFATISGRYIKEDGDNLIINHNVFVRGVIDPKELEHLALRGKYATRMYFPAVRYLYESSELNTRRVLKYLHKLLPILNREYNIVCHNPLETDIDKIEPMRIGEFCEAIGYDKSQSGRISRNLFDAKIPVGDHYENVIVRSSNMRPRRDDICICLNPRIFYAGGKESAEMVLTAFR